MVLLALWLPGCNQGGWRVDTPFYTAISRLMFAGGWDAMWFPMASDYPYFNKPPLPFWIHGLVYQVLGTELWAVRLPTLISGMLALEATRRAFMELGGRRVGLAAALVLALTVEFFRYTRAFSLDLWVVLFLMLAAWTAAAAVRREKPALLALGGIPIGLCLMCKPLFALAFPVIFAVWLAWIGRWRWTWWAAAMAAVGVAIAAPWHISMVARWGDLFIDEYFGRQTIGRAMGESFEAKPWWYLPAEFARSYWPWLVTLVIASWTWVRTGRLSRDARLDRLAVLWSAIFIVALAMFSGKKIRYAVPVYPALALLSGAWLVHGLKPRVARAWQRASLVIAPAAVVVAAALSAAPITWHEPSSQEFPRLYAALKDLGSPDVWCMPNAVRTSSTMYLQTGVWPKVVAASPELPGGYPKAGAVVLYAYRENADPTPPRPGDLDLGKFSAMRAVRLSRDWDAPYRQFSGMIARGAAGSEPEFTLALR